MKTMSIRSLWVQAPVRLRSPTGRSPTPAGLARGRSDVWSDLADAVAGLGEGRSPQTVLADAVGRLREAVGAERAVVWLDIGGQVRPEIADPPGLAVAPRAQLPAESETCAPVRYGGDRLGVLEITGPVLRDGTPTWVREVASAAASPVPPR